MVGGFCSVVVETIEEVVTQLLLDLCSLFFSSSVFFSLFVFCLFRCCAQGRLVLLIPAAVMCLYRSLLCFRSETMGDGRFGVFVVARFCSGCFSKTRKGLVLLTRKGLFL